MKDPTYCRSKGKGRPDRAFVDFEGDRVYLGEYGSDESYEHYHRAILEWRARGCRPPVSPDDLTVVELAAAYWQHAETYYRRADGTTSSELRNVGIAVRRVRELYGELRIEDFGPKQLKAVRQDSGCR